MKHRSFLILRVISTLPKPKFETFKGTSSSFRGWVLTWTLEPFSLPAWVIAKHRIHQSFFIWDIDASVSRCFMVNPEVHQLIASTFCWGLVFVFLHYLQIFWWIHPVSPWFSIFFQLYLPNQMKVEDFYWILPLPFKCFLGLPN